MAPDPKNSPGWLGMGTGWSITSELIGAMLTLGGLGYLLDLVFGTDRIFAGIGVVLGGGVGVYLVWLRHGREDR